MRPYLSNLQSLQRLCFTRDTYDTVYGYDTGYSYESVYGYDTAYRYDEIPEGHVNRHLDYYTSCVRCMDGEERAILQSFPNASALLKPEDPYRRSGQAHDAFHAIHHRRMRKEAERYGAAIPTLRSIFVGKLYFNRFVESDQSGEGNGATEESVSWRCDDRPDYNEWPEDIQLRATREFGIKSEY